MASITKRYNSKKRDARIRNIPFDMTIDEFSKLLSVAKRCAYTGIPFEKEGRNTVTIERVDDKGSYTASNVVCVIPKANLLKDVIDKEVDAKLTREDFKVVDTIQQTLDSRTKEEIVKEYWEKGEIDMTKENNEQKASDKLTVEAPVRDSKEILEENKDIALARLYLGAVNNFKGFNCSFSHYKKLMSKKKCMVSGVVFQDEGKEKLSLCKKELDLPWTDANTMVVTSLVKSILSSGLTSNDLTKIADFKAI